MSAGSFLFSKPSFQTESHTHRLNRRRVAATPDIGGYGGTVANDRAVPSFRRSAFRRFTERTGGSETSIRTEPERLDVELDGAHRIWLDSSAKYSQTPGKSSAAFAAPSSEVPLREHGAGCGPRFGKD